MLQSFPTTFGTAKHLFEPADIGGSLLNFDVFSQPGYGTAAQILPAEFTERLAYYRDMEYWYSGKAFDQRGRDAQGNVVEYYPLRINPFKTLVNKHVYALLGISNGGMPLLHKAASREDWSAENRARLDNLVNRLLVEAGAPSVLSDFARAAQVDGGFFVRAGISLQTRSPYWQFLDPKVVFVVPYADHIQIAEAWLFLFISAEEAYHRYKYQARNDNIVLLYREHWTPRRMEIYIEDKRVRNEANPYGFVPFVYIPRLRETGFWGRSLIEDLIGLARELNLRFADFGDAVHDDASSVLAMRNTTSPRRRNIDGLDVYDLGLNQGVGQSAEPDLWDVKRSASAKASQAMENNVDKLWTFMLRLAEVPPVAFGEDEGSQRSALTLETRFWPLTARADDQRRYWETMLRRLTEMTLRMIEQKQNVISEEWHPPSGWRSSDIAFRWNEQLPRDIETVVKNLAVRAQNNLGSPETLLAALPDVDNPAEEVAAIKDWLSFLASLKAKARAAGQDNAARSERKGAQSASATISAPNLQQDIGGQDA